MVRKETGFTLLEVLVAAFILFLVIAAMTLVYRGAVLSSNKAERSLRFVALVEPICEQIRIQVRNSTGQGKLQGEGTMGEVTYTWSADESEKVTEPDYFDADQGEFITGSRSFSLWTIRLDLKYGNSSHPYQFEELSW
jgi:type II secretory pathway pseudopilin PulG